MSLIHTKPTWSEQIAVLITNAATEIGEFQVQLALGKAEAADEFERLKKKLSWEFSSNGTLYSVGKRQYITLVKYFDELQVQLALGKAETHEVYVEQKKNINEALVNIANEIGKYRADDPFRNAVRSEIEKTRIKLEILRLHYRISSMSRKETGKKVDDIKTRANHLRHNSDTKENIGKLEYEIETAYKHLKDSFI